MKFLLLFGAVFLFATSAHPALSASVYWNVFNVQGDTTSSSDIVTYDTLTDMEDDTNRTGVGINSGFGRNIVGAGSDGTTFWNVFNVEGETSSSADIVTYGSLADMQFDTNRTGLSILSGFGRNIVGSGSDGTNYWNVFNVQGDTTSSADIVTYASLSDMMNDTNRTGVSVLSGFGRNVIGSGSDGTSYWNVFNVENETSSSADIVTYASLSDMMNDTNRTGVSVLSGFGRNVVGSGASVPSITPIPPVPVPASLPLLASAIGIGAVLRRRRKS